MTTPKSPFAASLAIHAGVAILILTTVSVQTDQPKPRPVKPALLIDLAEYRRTLQAPARPAGGGGGGDRSLLPVSRGQLPKPAPRQFAPPMIVHEQHEWPILVAPTVIMDAAALLTPVSFPQWGDPRSNLAAPSNGSGSGGGMGTGKDGGFGSGTGPGAGPGSGSGAPGSALSKIVAPTIIYQVEPEFSEEARRARHQGIVRLQIDVDASGRAVNVRIVNSLGLGLDEKAVDAVSRWRFRPAYRDGKPVTSPATVDVNFHLL